MRHVCGVLLAVLLSLASLVYAQQPPAAVLSGLLQNAQAIGNGDSLGTLGYTLATLQVVTTDAFDRTITWQMAADLAGTNFQPIVCRNKNSLVQSTTTKVAGQYECSIAGAVQIRAPISGGSAGTATITVQALSGVYGALPIGTGATVTLDSSTPVNVLALQTGTWTVQPGNVQNTTPWLMTLQQGGQPVGIAQILGPRSETTPTALQTSAAIAGIDPAAVTGRMVVSGLVESTTNPNVRIGLYQGANQAQVTNAAPSGAAQYALTVRPYSQTDGTNIMPTMDTAGRRGFQQISDGTVNFSAGQKTMANSFPAVIASDQSAIPVSQSGANWSVNVAQINGVTPLMGNGVTGTGSPRVTIASDNTAFSVNAAQSGTWTVQPGNTANTTPWLATINQGGNSATVTAANALKVDGSAVTQPVSIAGNQNVNVNQWASGALTGAITFGDAVAGNPAGPQIAAYMFANNGGVAATMEDRVRTASLANMPTAATLTARNSLGTVLTEKGSRWFAVSNPAAGSQATASIAAEVAVRHVIDCVSFSAVATTAPALTAVTINLRDGASGAGTVIWTKQLVMTVGVGQEVGPFVACGLNMPGTTNTAMTLEYSAGVANVIQEVSMSGFNVN